MTLKFVVFTFILIALLFGTIEARNHYGHRHVGGGYFEGPRGGHYQYNNYGERQYL